ncbi:unnamed protein product [Mytilus edulis]|uniref:Uncharacterized protein n=1 Tax=Mytilus edulis TaxID=6550 RepID=A0A8S3U785_MYTED|nr:unnamed protein product [Mytilus edulis]
MKSPLLNALSKAAIKFETNTVVMEIYSVKKPVCEIECSSHSECLDGYSCQTEGCDRICRPKRVILSNSAIRSDMSSSGCVQRCMDRGGLGCRSLCQRSIDSLSGGQIIPGGFLDSGFEDALVDSIRSDSLLGRISPLGDSIRSGSLGRHISPVGDSIRSDSLLGRISPLGDSIRSGSLVRHISTVGDSIRSGSLLGRISQVDSILHKGCQNTCISRGCNFNEECVTRDGCSVCVRSKTYA